MHDEILDAKASSSPPGARGEAVPEALYDEGRRVKRSTLLNFLNFINFSEGTIFACFRHPERGDRLSFQAFPLPCMNEVLECRWLPPGVSLARLRSYDCEGFLISDGHRQVSVKAQMIRLDAEGITFMIPESGFERSCRKVERLGCEGIQARIIQSGLELEGRLADFNALSFRVEAATSPTLSVKWLNTGAPVTVLFSRGSELLYSGECLIKRMGRGQTGRELVLAPNFNNIRRYKPREFRTQRHILAPAPALQFIHPLSGKRVFLQVRDISGGGVCVEEFFDRSTLLPGMVIPEISVEIANQFVMKCRAQVLYRNVARKEEEEENSVRCGIAFLDLEAQDQTKLAAFLHQSVNDRLRICGSVDMEELWRFFFETGFIYPAKYLSIEAHKADFKRTYQKLYLESPSIARHFIFQDRGRIFGHMSMIRFYSNAWIIQHHAAARDGHALAGAAVFDQTGRYCKDFHQHPSAHMDFIMCYYRRENRFPSRVFGSIAHHVADPRACSEDSFAYFSLPDDAGDTGTPFQLFPALAEDYQELARVYRRLSGGLALEALDFLNEDDSDAGLAAEFAGQGFKRARQVFALRQEGRLVAVMALTLSDLGLNLSNLTNCVHAFIVDPERLQPRTLLAGLRTLLSVYGAENVPVLAWPPEYLERNSMPFEKKYILWTANLDYSDGYFESLRSIFRRTGRDIDDGSCGG
jgi:hypothetical protein